MNNIYPLVILVQILCTSADDNLDLQFLQNEYQHLMEDVKSLKESYATTKHNLENIQKIYASTTQQLKDRLDKAESTIKSGALMPSGKERKRASSGYRFDQVAFDARLSHPQNHAGTEQTIVFDTVLTNVGNGYVKSLGFFEAPLSGVYLFSWTIASDYGTSIITKLHVNGNAVAAMHTDTGVEKTFRGSSTKVTILNLNRNDRVFVTITYNRGLVVSDNSSHSSFEGALLYTTDEI